MNSNNVLYRNSFSHIYVEERVRNLPVTIQILSRFPHATVIPVRHYMDVFSPHKQPFVLQKQSQKLILALQEGELIYPGAKVCQSFGNEHFYYTSNIMNCPYDCEYCYLQGMYPSANLVLFVNYSDVFRQIDRLLQEHPMYLCISYDTDLLALEHLTGYASRWMEFCASRPGLTIECRTKSAGSIPALDLPEALTAGLKERFLFAWTLSPDFVQQAYEHHTPSLDRRLRAITQAIRAGYHVRLCFDPMLRIINWRTHYETLFYTVFQTLEQECPGCLSDGRVVDCSLGTFRISKEYLGVMRRHRPDSVLVQYPFQTEQGVCSYGSKADMEMMQFACHIIEQWIPKERIFLWEKEE